MNEESGVEPAAEAEQAWAEFRVLLADRIAEMEQDEIIAIEVETGVDDEERSGSAPYLQLLAWDDDRVRAEASSNYYLDTRFELTTAEEARLNELG